MNIDDVLDGRTRKSSRSTRSSCQRNREGKHHNPVVVHTRMSCKRLELIIPALVWRHVRNIVQLQGDLLLQTSPSFKRVLPRVIVHLGFGHHDGFCATQIRLVPRYGDHCFFHFPHHFQGLMTRFQFPFSSLRHETPARVDECQLKGIVHFKFLVGIEHLGKRCSVIIPPHAIPNCCSCSPIDSTPE